MALIVAGAAVLAVAVLFLTSGQEPEFAVAFSGLTRDDAAAIVAQLREQGVAYRISADETAISVPTDRVHDVRLSMASAGLPSGGTIGFEIFDATNLGMTDFTQQVNYRRAIEGELARTVASLEAVQEARVHIVIPEPSIYSDLENAPTASVLLRLHPGKGLTRDQVRGIAHLVSSSVEGLAPENITILDTGGQVLSDTLVQTEGQLRDEQFQAQRAYEQALEAKLRSMLETTLGPGRAAVSVSALFDWTEVETSRETYETPEAGEGVVRSAREIREVQGGGATSVAAGGAAGVDANVPSVPSYTGVFGTQPDASAQTEPGFERTDLTYNYEVSKVVSHSVHRPGRLERLSVSVLVDSVSDEALLESVRQAVAAAAGVDPRRGDQLTVETMPFDRTHIEQQQAALAEADRQESYVGLVRWGALALGIAAVLFLAVRGVARRRAPATPEVTTVTSRPEALEAGAQLAIARAEANAALGAGDEEQSVADIATVQHQLINLARRQPEVVAQVVQFWLAEPSQARRQ
jgi:flagellar M-ring protein FliF